MTTASSPSKSTCGPCSRQTGRDHDRLAVTHYRGGILHEDQRTGQGASAAHLGGVLGVVAPDGEDRGGEIARHRCGVLGAWCEYSGRRRPASRPPFQARQVKMPAMNTPRCLSRPGFHAVIIAAFAWLMLAGHASAATPIEVDYLVEFLPTTALPRCRSR
jgi:hypothetical protein